jgi:hypothetical protein
MVKVFFPSAAQAPAPRRTIIAPIATEPANTSRREWVLPAMPYLVWTEALALFSVAEPFMAVALSL